MKKFFLFIAALSVAAAGMAQQPKPMHKSMVTQLPMMNKQMQIAETPADMKKPIRKTFSTGLYYTNPAGAYYGGWDTFTGSGFYNSTLIVPAFMDVPFVNRSTQSAVWTVDGEEHPDQVQGDTFTTYSYRSNGYLLFYPPSLEGDETYTFGEVNVYNKRGYITSDWHDGFIRTDSLATLYPTDPQAAIEWQDEYYNPYQSWGLLDTDNLFGSGDYVSQETTLHSYAAAQPFPAPLSPLFVTEVDVEALTSTQPIPEGMELRCLVTGVQENQWSSGDTFMGPDYNNIIAELICTSADTLGFYSTTTRNKKTLKTGTLRFMAPGEEDELGNIIPQNIVIDQPYCLVITGFEQEGIDCGLYGIEVVEEDQEEKSPALLLLTETGEETRILGYGGFINLAISLYGMFDRAVCEPQMNYYNFENPERSYNVVRVPVEGSPDEYGYGNMTEGSTASPLTSKDETADGYPGVPVLTNTYWFDTENELLNYDVIDLPDWIEDYYVDPSGFSDGGMNLLFFKAKPLPAGVTGRQAVVRVVGQEVTMNGETKYSAISGPIVILQGDAAYDSKVTDAIRNSSFTGTAYNMAGQKVDGAYKGIVIKNGHKYVNQ